MTSQTVVPPYTEVKEPVRPSDPNVRMSWHMYLQLPTGERFVVAIVSGTEVAGARWVCEVFEVTNGQFDANSGLWGFMLGGRDLDEAQMVYRRMLERLYYDDAVGVCMTEFGMRCSDGGMM